MAVRTRELLVFATSCGVSLGFAFERKFRLFNGLLIPRPCRNHDEKRSPKLPRLRIGSTTQLSHFCGDLTGVLWRSDKACHACCAFLTNAASDRSHFYTQS